MMGVILLVLLISSLGTGVDNFAGAKDLKSGTLIRIELSPLRCVPKFDQAMNQHGCDPHRGRGRDGWMGQTTARCRRQAGICYPAVCLIWSRTASAEKPKGRARLLYQTPGWPSESKVYRTTKTTSKVPSLTHGKSQAASTCLVHLPLPLSSLPPDTPPPGSPPATTGSARGSRQQPPWSRRADDGPCRPGCCRPTG